MSRISSRPSLIFSLIFVTVAASVVALPVTSTTAAEWDSERTLLCPLDAREIRNALPEDPTRPLPMSSCTAEARCWDGSTVNCSGDVCQEGLAQVTCDGQTTSCAPFSGQCTSSPRICDDTYCNNKCPSIMGNPWVGGYCDETQDCCVCTPPN